MSRCKVWRLKEAEIRESFCAKVEERLAMRVDGREYRADDGQVDVWC